MSKFTEDDDELIRELDLEIKKNKKLIVTG